jgi:hypothetical protein
MRFLMTGVSGFALACLAGGALAQDKAAPGAMPEAERAADQITCGDLSAMQTTLVPGVLYFVAGHREGAAAGTSPEGGQAALDDAEGEQAVLDGAEGEQAVLDDPEGEMAGMEDATVAQEAQLEPEEEPGVGPAVAGREEDPAVDEPELLGAEADTDEAEVDLAEDENGAAEMAETEEGELAVDEAALDGDAAPEMGLEPELAEGETEAAEAVRVRGHFEIPIEQTVIACSQDPDALVADVIEDQRHAGIAGEPEEIEPEEEG